MNERQKARRKKWREYVESRKGKRRRLMKDNDPELVDLAIERCVICDKRTMYWLMPENAPLCKGTDCKEKYLKNPRVYDPRGLYGLPN